MTRYALLVVGVAIMLVSCFGAHPEFATAGAGLIGLPMMLTDPTTPEQRRAARDKRIAELEQELGL